MDGANLRTLVRQRRDGTGDLERRDGVGPVFVFPRRLAAARLRRQRNAPGRIGEFVTQRIAIRRAYAPIRGLEHRAAGTAEFLVTGGQESPAERNAARAVSIREFLLVSLENLSCLENATN